MKKISSLILICLMAIGLAACTEQGSVNSDKTKTKVDANATQFDINFAKETNTQLEKVDGSTKSFLAVAQNPVDGLFGYINLKGNWVIEPQFKAASAFSEGYAFVLDQYNEYCIINQSGETVLLTYKNKSINEASYFSEGLTNLKLDLGYGPTYMYFNSEFTPVINASHLPKVRGRSYSDVQYFGLATPFRDGKAVVMRLKNSNITDKKGAESAYVIDKEGNILATLPEGLDPDEYGFDDQGNIVVMDSNKLYGLCSSDGTLIIECKYKKMQHCDGPLYMVCNDNGFFGYINAIDEKIIDYKYQKAMPFSEGIAAVYNGTYWGLISESGEVISNFQFDNIVGLKSANLGSNINKGAVSNGVLAVLKNGQWKLLTKYGVCIMSIAQNSYQSYKGEAYISENNGYISFMGASQDGDACGVLDINGKLVIEPSFKSIGIFR